MLEEQDTIVRTAVARELQVRGGEKVFKTALHYAKSKTPFSREIAAFLLGQLGTPHYPFKERSIPLLSSLLKDSDSDVRAAAVGGLTHLNAYSALEEISMLQNDTSHEVREMVEFALQFLRPDVTSAST